MQEYNDDGILKLAIALVKESRDECMACVEYGDYIAARVIADKDARGLVGYICEWTCGDKLALAKEINKEIEKDKSTKKGRVVV